jgi:hypothetical protein
MTNHRKNGDFRTGNTARQVGDTPAEGHLHIRVPMDAKARWVQASRTVAGRGLSQWVIQALDTAADSELGKKSAQTRDVPPA